MQRDFHFYCTAVLARAAGFSSREALIIGYCAQYVDDSTESETIPIQVAAGQPPLLFEPTCTSYNPLDPRQGLQSITWGAQKRIFIPFHFIPNQPLDLAHPQLPFSYITEAHSPFAEFLLAQAGSDKHPLRRLCRIGVALHTYADSWAHQGFTGRKEPLNDIENIQARDPESGQWLPQHIENLADGVMPEIGHAEALYFPDIPYIEWRCDQQPGKPQAGGYNARIYLDAAQHIYTRLRILQGRIRASERRRGLQPAHDPIPWENKPLNFIPWDALAPHLFQLFQARPQAAAGWLKKIQELKNAADPAWRCELWRDAFQGWFDPPGAAFPFGFDYDKYQLRNHAVTGDTAWDDRKPSDWKDITPLQLATAPLDAAVPNLVEVFWDKPWVQFHRAALTQRHLVLERIP